MTDKVSKRTAAAFAAVAVVGDGVDGDAGYRTATSRHQRSGADRSRQDHLCAEMLALPWSEHGHCRHGRPDLRAFPDDNARFTTTVKHGKNNMPPWKDILSDQEITEVWAFVSSRRKP